MIRRTIPEPKAGLLRHDILHFYDRGLGALLTEHEGLGFLLRDAKDKLTNEFAKIAAIALAEYSGTATLLKQCTEEVSPIEIPPERMRQYRLMCAENDKRFNPFLGVKIDSEMAKVMMRDMLTRMSIAEMKKACKSVEPFKEYNLSQLDRVWIERICVEANKQ